MRTLTKYEINYKEYRCQNFRIMISGNMKTSKLLFVLSLLILHQGFINENFAQGSGKSAKPVQIRVEMDNEIEDINPVWAWFGHDEPNYTYMKDGKKLLTEISEANSVPVYVRTHNLLTTGDGIPALKWGSSNAYTEDDEGNPVYDWTIVDKIFDTYVERGMKPLVEIGFMPEALSVKPDPYRHYWKPGDPYNDIYTGWAYPPKDYEKWAELVYQWVSHSVDKYGMTEVETWYWELWNEPNINYWMGTTEEYLKLYDFTADAVKRALPTAIMGGPHSTGPAHPDAERFLRTFLDHCLEGKNFATGKKGSPLDFIGFHAKGSPKFLDGRIRMDLGKQMRDVSAGFEIVASYPAFKHLPIVIGESDPEGCAACPMTHYAHNGYRNGTMYSSYTAAAFPRKLDLAKEYGVNFKGAVTWAFEFEDQPWYSGFRDLATNGVDKPVLNVFRMFGMMQGKRIDVSGDLIYDYLSIRAGSVRGENPDIGALASRTENSAAIMVWNYHDDNSPAPSSAIDLLIEDIPSDRILVQHYRIDQDFSNSYAKWIDMGSPQQPVAEEYAILERSGQLELYESPFYLDSKAGEAVIQLDLPRQGVSLLMFNW